jgi:M6 family metalloprotease-like protein
MRTTRAVLAIALATSAAAVGAATASAAGPPAPIDAQNWSFQDNLTWSDYKPIPGPDYSDPSIQPTKKKWKVALVVTDFPDKPFALTQPAGGTVFGTPTAAANSVPRADVPAFLRDLLNKPQPLNHFQTMNRYWMEDSFGQYGVQLDAYGPYQLPKRSYQYFMNDFKASENAAHCPDAANFPCNGNFRTDARNAWVHDPPGPGQVSTAEAATYDNIFYVSAGEDESSTWQEFGEMKWMTKEQVPDAFGPKVFDPAQTNWAATRYVDWSSWASVSTIWPNASGNTSIEAESSGMGTYAHELTHNLNIPDNYNNPFIAPFQRTASGMWDMMSRGSFNGPGGQHTRFQIPPTDGGSLGSQHNMRNKRFLGFTTDNDLLRLNRNGLAQTGLVVADIKAREAAPNGALAGLRVNLDGGDLNRVCPVAQAGIDLGCEGPWRQTNGSVVGFNDYTMEVVQQIGADSFDPGHGVLIGKSKTGSSTCGSYSCFVWYIDSHPEDINQVDFVRPDGTVAKATSGDERQLNDGSFNAGTNSGSKAEYTADANRLQFYILDKSTDAQGILHYKVGVRSLDGSGPQTRGVSLGAPKSGASEGFTTCTFPLTNTGAAAAVPNVHPQDVTQFVNTDIYRLSAATTGTGWHAYLANEFASAKFGETVQVPVYVSKDAGAGAGQVTLTAKSESDPSKTVSATCSPVDGTVGGTVPATLSLSLGTPASFGALTPGLQKDYFATTTANVISTAADAKLSVADPSATATGHLVNGTFSLPEGLQANAVLGTTSNGVYAPVGGSASPTSLLTWSAPASNDAVTIGFKQPVKSNDALRTGQYSKTLTFTLSTTQP